MARPLHIKSEDVVYHVMSRGNERRATSLPGRQIAQAPGYPNVSSITLAGRRLEAAFRAGRLVEATASILNRLATNH